MFNAFSVTRVARVIFLSHRKVNEIHFPFSLPMPASKVVTQTVRMLRRKSLMNFMLSQSWRHFYAFSTLCCWFTVKLRMFKISSVLLTSFIWSCLHEFSRLDIKRCCLFFFVVVRFCSKPICSLIANWNKRMWENNLDYK